MTTMTGFVAARLDEMQRERYKMISMSFAEQSRDYEAQARAAVRVYLISTDSEVDDCGQYVVRSMSRPLHDAVFAIAKRWMDHPDFQPGWQNSDWFAPVMIPLEDRGWCDC